MQNPELQALVQVQDLDCQIRGLRNRLEQIPEEIRILEEKIAAGRQSVQDLRGRIEENNRELRKREGEVDTLRQRLSKLKFQLLEVKTNKEYQAMLSEIATVEREISDKETEVLEHLLKLDELQADLKRREKACEVEEQNAQQTRKGLENELAESESGITKLFEEKDRLETSIPSDLMMQFHRIASVRNGVAMAQVRDQSCQACHVKLRPQLYAEIRSARLIAFCESCNRILYDPSTFAAAGKSVE